MKFDNYPQFNIRSNTTVDSYWSNGFEWTTIGYYYRTANLIIITSIFREEE